VGGKGIRGLVKVPSRREITDGAQTGGALREPGGISVDQGPGLDVGGKTILILSWERNGLRN